MDLWIDLLFGNWIGILSIATVLGSFLTVTFLLLMLYRKSHKKEK